MEESSGDSAAAPRSPAASIVSIPVRAMPAFSVQFSEPETESDDDNAPKTHAAASSAMEAEEHAEKTASSPSGGEEKEEVVDAVESEAAAKGKQDASEVNSDDSDSSDSSAYLIGQSVPSEIAEALGMRHAKLIGGQVIGKIRFESETIFPKLMAHFASRSWSEGSCWLVPRTLCSVPRTLP